MNLRSVKKTVATSILGSTLVAGLFAIPLSALVTKESEKIADSIRAFNKDCGGDTSFVDQPCMDRRYKLSSDLGQFVALLNDELNFLNEPASTPPPGYEAQAAEDEKRFADRRKDMQLHIRWAHYWMDCLGREDASECKQERAALDKEIYPFGRVGLMTQEPTHVGEEEAKHWHSMKGVMIKSGQGELVFVDEKAAAVFVENFVKALASSDLDTQLGYYADQVNYYEFGQVTKEVIRKDLERDITTWPNRNYSMPDQPKITITPNGDGFIAEFRMRYTLTNPKGTSSGTLQMKVRLKPQAQTPQALTWQVVEIQKKVIQATKEEMRTPSSYATTLSFSAAHIML
jgi:hypothetical protein